jgi:plastocyanin
LNVALFESEVVSTARATTRGSGVGVGEVTASVGDTLRIFNDDSVPHRLHTDGVPFTHPASDIQPGTSVDYVLTAPFSSAAGHTLYDHDHGVEAAFWLTVLAKA